MKKNKETHNSQTSNINFTSIGPREKINQKFKTRIWDLKQKTKYLSRQDEISYIWRASANHRRDRIRSSANYHKEKKNRIRKRDRNNHKILEGKDRCNRNWYSHAFLLRILYNPREKRISDPKTLKRGLIEMNSHNLKENNQIPIVSLNFTKKIKFLEDRSDQIHQKQNFKKRRQFKTKCFKKFNKTKPGRKKKGKSNRK